jgi:hypothetical protein
MSEVVVDDHKCLNTYKWSFELKDARTLQGVCQQISALSHTYIQPLEWLDPNDLKIETWCLFRGWFPTQEAAMEFILKWQ